MNQGIYRDIPFDAYRQWPLLSQSTLKEGRYSMAHLKAAIDRDRQKEPTDDMLLGSALHTCFLEPELMPERVVKWTGGVRRGKKWESFKAGNPGKIILTPNYHEKLIGMVRSLRRHPVVREWTNKIESVEVSAVGEINGVPMKGRCDALTPEPLFDLKKVGDGDERSFVRNVMDFGYHIQAYTYLELFRRERFVLMTVEDFDPFDVVPYEFSGAFLRKGRREVTSILNRYKQCKESGIWPGRSDGIWTLELPTWAASGASEISIGGELAFQE
jgi:hypothetical protein